MSRFRPHPTLFKGEGFEKHFLKVSPFGGDLEGVKKTLHQTH